MGVKNYMTPVFTPIKQGISYLQCGGQVFNILLSAYQGDGESWFYLLLLNFVDEMDLELIMINCIEKEITR